MKKLFYILTAIFISQSAFSQYEVTSLKLKNTPATINDTTQVDVLVRENSGTNKGMVRKITWEYLSSIIGGGDGSGVQSVTGSGVDNTDPENPVVNALPLTGGTLTGTVLSRDINPSTSLTYSLGNPSMYFLNAYMFNLVSNGIQARSGDFLKFQNSLAQRTFTVFENGNLNIGSSTSGTPPTNKLNVEGSGNFTGTVGVATPTSSQHATTKAYVDAAVSNYLPLTGNTFGTGITGPVYIANDNPTIYLSRSNNGSTIQQTSTALNITPSAYGGTNKLKINASSIELLENGGNAISFTHGPYTNTLPNVNGFLAANGYSGYTSKTNSYTILSNDHVVDLTANTATFTLPTAVGISGREYTVKNSGTGVLTLTTTSGQTIDGVTSKILRSQYSSLKVISNGANWKVTDRVDNDNTTGWMTLRDSTYVSGSPLVLTANTPVKLTNDGTYTYDAQKPSYLTTFYNTSTQKLLGHEGDLVGVQISFTFTPTTANSTRVTVVPDIGGSVGQLLNYAKDITFSKGNGVPQYYLSSYVVYQLDTFEANGAEFFVKADSAGEITNIQFTFHMEHRAKD